MSLSLLAVSVGVSASRARAQQHADAAEREASARSAFEAGRDAYDRGAFGEALTYFERAHALSPKPELLYDIGHAADSDGQTTRAIAAYSAYLEAYPDSDNRAYVRARLEKVRAQEKLRTVAAPSRAPAEGPVVEATRGAPSLGPRAVRRDDASRPAWKRAWPWLTLGALVVAGSVTAGVLATRGADPKPTPADWYVRVAPRSP
ncbi:MAG: outer membrane protein assembly factor BamD [Polyangiales bacterium]